MKSEGDYKIFVSSLYFPYNLEDDADQDENEIIRLYLYLEIE